MDRFIIYSNFGQRVSSWDVSSATGNYTIPILPSGDLDSLIVYNIEGDIDYDLVQGNALFGVGDEVAVYGEIGAYAKHVIGTVTHISNDHIEIINNNEKEGPRTYRIKKYKQLAIKKRSDDQSKITVNLSDLDKLNLSYMFGEVGWSANYNIVLENDNIKTFKLTGKVYNNNGNELEGDIVLVAGNVSPPVPDVHQPTAIRSMSMAEQTEGMNEGMSDEYHHYHIGSHKVKKNKNIKLLSVNDIGADKYYFHVVTTKNRVEYGYQLKAPNFLPVGKVYLYNKHGEDVIYVGTTQMKERQEGDDVELMLGNTSKVQVESHVTSVSLDDNGQENHKKNNDKRSEINIMSTIENHNDNKANIILKYYVGRNKILSSTYKYELKKDHVQWKITLNPKEKAVFENKLVLLN